MKRRWLIAAAAIAALLAASPASAELTALARLDPSASGVTDIPAAIAGGQTGGIVLSLALSQKVPYRVFFLADPPRLVVDFREVDFGQSDPSAADRSAHVQGLSWGAFRPGWSRLVAELDGPYLLETAQEIDTAGGARIDLRLVPGGADAAVGQPADPGWDLPPPAPVSAPKARQDGNRPLVVVLDPGHGGLDPGAEAGKLREAWVVLAFADELAEVLRRAGMVVEVTRSDDTFVPLEARISIARAAAADLFLSIHADALEEGVATGATVYKLSLDASDDAARQLAERHDRADLLAGVDLTEQDDQIAGVLMDMARIETGPRADRLAARLAEAIGASGVKLHRHPIQQAAFSVLKSPDIPSVLLEIGFLSSARDRERFADPVWRAAMVEAIRAGIATWAEEDAAEARKLRQ